MMFDLPVLEGWRLVKLSDLGEVNRGRSRHRPRDATHLYGGIYPFVQTGDIKASGGRVVKYSQTYSEDGLAQSRLWPKGTMCITIAANIAETGILQFPACFPDSVIGFIADEHKCNVYFIEYVFRLLRRQIQAQATGSVQDNINLQTLERLLFPIPEIEEQKRIAEVLCSFDNKIELNRQTNQTLEHIAQAIFKSWFVDFEPTRAKIKAKKHWQAAQQNIKASSASDYAEPSDKQHQHTTSLQEAMNRTAMAAISGKTEAELNNLPADTLQQLRTTAELFPDTLVESELGEIPAGWSIGSIGDVAKAKGGYAFKGKSFLEEGNPVIKIKNITGDGRVDLAGTVCIDDEQAKIAERFKLDDGDLLMAMTGATVAKIGFVVTAGKSVYLNQRVAKFESEKFGSKISWFLYCCFQRYSIFDSVVGAAQGSAQPNISSSGIESTELVLPTDKLVETFCTKVDSLFRQWILNINENSMLIETRDTLLPKLLSGELTLTEKQTILEASA